MSTLIATGVVYFSQGDEDSFFRWLEGIPCVVGVRGVGRELRIEIQDEKVGSTELSELIGLFHRYKVDMKQLARFLSTENAGWFRDDIGAFWHEGVFG